MHKSIETKRGYPDDSFQNIHLCFPLKFKSKADNTDDLEAGVIPVNNFFADWIRESNIVRYGDERPILPTTDTVDIYRYSNELLKHMPDKQLVTIENNLLYCKGKVTSVAGRDRRVNSVANGVDAPESSDPKLTKIIQKFQDQLKMNVFIGSFKIIVQLEACKSMG